MEDLHKFKQDLRAKFLSLVKHSASEDKFIQVISSTLNNKLDLKAMEVILDLSLTTVDQYGCVNFNHLEPNSSSTSVKRHEETICEHDPVQRVPDMSSYDGDDEECDDIFIFPCHFVYDECHPEPLSDYHREHLKPSRNLTQIIKLPKLCEFVIASMFDSFKSYMQTKRGAHSEGSLSSDSSREQRNQKSPLLNCDDFRSDSPMRNGFCNSGSISVGGYLTFIVKLIKRVNKVCLNERRNCRILAKTGMLNVVLENINYLIEVTPDDQYIYLEPLLKFAFTLSDYRISGTNLKQFFSIIKNEETDLKVVLKDLERLLDHHYRILRNIQPSRSINFPAASKTPEEIEYDRYVANSWHWRLRSKVIEYKRRRSRSESQSQEFKLTTNHEQFGNKKQSTGTSDIKAEQQQQLSETIPRPSPSNRINKITPSWLECSLIAPISNISPLIHNKGIKFCCTLWMSICGDLLVVEGNKWNRRHRKRGANSDNFDVDWSALSGHWLRLTSRRRLVRRHKNKVVLNLKSRKRRLSAKIRSRQAYDKEDEEREEIENKIRKSDAEMSQGHARSGRRFKLFHSSLSRQPKSSTAVKQQESLYKNSRFDHVEDQTPKRECLGRRARDNSQELLVHLVSFAMDSLTIEIWLNVKFMTFCARACRVTREGQTNLLDQVTFSSHLKANGSWSNLIFCLEEVKGKYDQDIVMKLDVIVNGVHKEKEKLAYNAHKSPLTNFAILVGCERSTYGYVWKLSQINIYKNIPDKSMPIYLLGKGPDFWSFTNFRQQSILPMPEITQRHMKNFLDPKVLMRYSAIDELQMLNWLTQNIVISYVAQQSDHFLDYSPGVTTASLMPADYEFSNSAERFIQAKTLDFTRSIKFNQNNGFGSALVEAGGIESVLMSFAEVVRRSQETTPQAHALAFSVLLKMSRTNLYHLNKFLDELNGLKLVEYILTHPKCKVSEPMLESYFDFCLANGKSTRWLIKSPKLIYHLMTSWRAWHKDAKVARLFYRRLIELLQPLDRISERHRYDLFYTSYNFKMMTQAGAIDILMDVLRECLVSADENSHYIDHELVELIVTLISLLIKHPPGLDVLLDTMEFLLFLHPDPKSYVEASQNRISFLHKIKYNERERVVFDDMPSRTRTPYTITPSSSQSEAASSREELDRIGESPELELYDSTIRGRFRANNDGNSSEDDDDDLSMSFKNRISNQCSQNIAEIIEKFKSNHQTSLMSDEDSLDEELMGKYENNQRRLSGVGSARGGQRSLSFRCSNRNYAIANIADLLFLSVKLVDATEILSEALQKYILDPRKLIILSNNDSPLVREKVLRLFLLCIRACYEPNMKNILAIYEQETKSINYNICTPIHLMAPQLLKYPTSMRMIQFCYGIIVGVHDLEIIDTECLILNLETINHHLQLNTLVLLIQLTTKLQKPKDMVSSLRFILAYVTQLVYLGEDVTVSVIIKNNIIDCMMSLYFSYVESTVALARRRGQNSRYGTAISGEDEEIRPTSSKSSNNENHYASLVDELDKLLVFVVRFYIENNSSSELIKSIDELLLYLDLLNSNVPSEFHHLLRDRKNMVLMTMLKYCRHYEECAKQRTYGGRLDYYLKNFLKSTDINKFSNTLPEFHLNDLLNDTSNRTSIESGEGNGKDEDSSILYENGGQRNSVSNGDQNQESLSSHDDYSSNGSSGNLVDKCATSENDTLKEITEASVIERFKITFQLISNSVTARDPKVIPSPFERNFIMRCLNILARYIADSERTRTKRRTKQTTHWTLMLAKLDHTFRSCFSRLVLYLLSPNDANLDERKYYAHQILNAFEVDQLLGMLEENSSRSNHRVLLVFIKDLLYYCTPQRDDSIQSDEAMKVPSECNTSISDVDDEVMDDIEFKLLEFISELKLKIGDKEEKYSSMALYRTGRTATQYSEMDQSCRAIWLEDLARDRGNLHDRLATFRMDLMTNNKPATNGSLENLTTITVSEMDSFLDEAVRITKEVVNDKHEQRKAYLEDVKQNKIHNYHIRQQWLSLIIGHTHERAIWFMDDFYPKSWELNPVEGPSRTRRRLRPCKLMLESRFLRNANSQAANFSNKLPSNKSLPSGQITPDSQLDDFTDPDDWYSLYSPHPLCSLIINNEQSLDSNELRIRMFTTDKIHFNCDCSIIRPNEVCEGEVSIASWCIHFIGERNEDYQQQILNTTGDGRGIGTTTVVRQLQNRFSPDKHNSSSRHLDTDGSSGVAFNNEAITQNNSVSDRTRASRRSPMSTVVEDLWFDEIVEIWDRRYQLQDVGLEIFLTNNMTYLLSFRNNSDREDFKQHLMREQLKMINFQRFNLTTSLNRSTQLWRDGKLTNFDYLTCLNKLAGRSFNDLMQYPVFPFVLSNYTTNTLNLNEASNFRNLKKPMAIQNEDRETNFKNNYHMSLNSSLTIGSLGLTKPYHYGNHYSNSATVLHFLVRLQPFTQMLIQYQDNNFDQPDRTFHAIANTWQLITRDSNTDFKELIPEFFFLPEMFTNIGDLELGRKQNNELVDDIKLPAWCPHSDARLFTLIHRQALESAYVSENLHHWIDLIFGYKQTGKAAIEALNVFHPATYYGGIDLSSQSSQRPLSSTTDSLSSAISTTFATTKSTKSSTYGSGSIPNADLSTHQSSSNRNISTVDNQASPSIEPDNQSPRRLVLNKCLQAEIERSALETMIKTYGQMPRQLFSQPMKQRPASSFAQQINEGQLEKQQRLKNGAVANRINTSDENKFLQVKEKFEPLIKGLRWGNYVGSPADDDIIAIEHKRIILEPATDYRTKESRTQHQTTRSESTSKREIGGPKLLSKQSDKFHFCMLANGDVAILRNNTSLMLDYRADRKSSGTYHLSIPSARYSTRRAGLSRVGRMNLFSNMIISRQQFSFLEPIHSGSGNNQFNPNSSRIKFSLDSLNLVSWFYLDGTIRVKHPAPSNQQPSIPLVQANTIVDSMTTCVSVPELNLLLVGYQSGSVCAHIVSTTYETVLKQKYNSASASTSNVGMSSSSSGGMGAVHFLHTISSSSVAMDASMLGPGRVTQDKTLTGELYTPLSLAGETLQSVRFMNKTARWLYCHNKRINCIKINVSFGIVVTGSNDGTSAIWDLNSLTYVRTIDYKVSSLRVRRDEDYKSRQNNTNPGERASPSQPSKSGQSGQHFLSWAYGRAHKQHIYDYLCNCQDQPVANSYRGYSSELTTRRCSICASGVDLIAISDTLGDVVTVKHLSDRLVDASEFGDNTDQETNELHSSNQSMSTAGDGNVSMSSSRSPCSESNFTSVIYVHTINGALVNFVNCHTQVTAVCYSNAPEGISINVIVVGMVGGLIRLYSSWDLSRVKQFYVSGLFSPINDIMYTRDSQLMYIAYEDGQMVVLRNRKKGHSFSMPKEWIL